MTYARKMAGEIAERIGGGKFKLDAEQAEEVITEVIDRCAKAAVAAVNDCRGEGETDLRSVRSWVNQAIRDPDGYAAERSEPQR